MTISQAIRNSSDVIRQAKVGDSPQLDAELLVGSVTAMDRVALRINSEQRLSARQLDELSALVKRRQSGEPVAYIVGVAWFYGREFMVDPRVLIPRSETELLVEIALEYFADHDMAENLVDVGTGSGCIAVTLASELADRAHVTATDISADALEVAVQNANRHNVKVEFLCSNLLSELVKGSFTASVILANPPYIDGPEAMGLDPHVRDFEPDIALFFPRGEDLSSLYERLAHEAIQLLEHEGMLAVEHGQGQRDLVMQALHREGFLAVEGLDDLAGIDRVVRGYRGRQGPS